MNAKAVKLVLFVGVLGISFLIAAPLRAQVAGATLSGTIADSMGAAVPNATVSITNTATGVVVSTTTTAPASTDLHTYCCAASNFLPVPCGGSRVIW